MASGTSPRSRFISMLRTAATCSSTSVWPRQCMYLAGEDAPPTEVPLFVFTSCTSVSGSGNGTGFSSTALTTEKIAMLTPMPSVSAAIAVAANSLFSRNMRQACLMSLVSVSIRCYSSRKPWLFVAQRLERMNAARAPRRDPDGRERRRRKHGRHADEDHYVARLDTVEDCREERGQIERGADADGDAHAHERHTLAHDAPAHFFGLSAERHANADLLRAMLH